MYLAVVMKVVSYTLTALYLLQMINYKSLMRHEMPLIVVLHHCNNSLHLLNVKFGDDSDLCH